MPKGVGPDEWSRWLDRYQNEVAATGEPWKTEEAVQARFGTDLELVSVRVRSSGGPPAWAVRHAALGVKAVEEWLNAEEFTVRRASKAHDEFADVLGRLPSPGFLPDLVVGDRHAFFVEVRRTSVTSGGHYSRILGTGELALDTDRVQAFEAVEEMTGMPIFVLFVDEPLGRVYGNWLAELLEPRVLPQGRGRLRTAYPRVRRDRGNERELTCFPYPAAFRPVGTVASGRRFRLARGAERDVIRIEGHPEF